MEENKSKIKNLKMLIQKHTSEIFKLKSIINHLPGNIYWKNKKGIYLGINNTSSESMKKFNFQLCKPEEIIGKSDYDLFSKEMADSFRKHDLEVMKTEEESTREEVATLPSGEVAIQLSTKRPLYDENGKVVGVIGNTVDITYLKKIENELRISKEKTEEANLLKMEFIHNMEHDIRTPFNGIYGLTNILLREETNSKKKIRLGYISHAAKELLDYCNSILDFSKNELGNLPITSKKFDVKKLSEKIIAIEMPAAKSKNLELKLQIKDVPQFIIGDEYRVSRILINLISNAIKFTHEGHVSLKMSAHPGNNKKSVILRFLVEDTGIGVPQDKQMLIYEKFTKLHPSNHGKYKGLGLGLAVVKQFTDELDGELELISEVGKGTKFACIIPFKLPLLKKH